MEQINQVVMMWEEGIVKTGEISYCMVVQEGMQIVAKIVFGRGNIE